MHTKQHMRRRALIAGALTTATVVALT
ncbi:MAG: hypothetical protein K0Q52_3486, partial [Microbacterium sp.]|nr:hypothetical protein [Microbacterium sp.]